MFGSFFLGAFCSIASVLWSISTTKEIPPSEEELQRLRNERGDFLKRLFQPFIDIFSAIGNMPKNLWRLALVYLFQWYALFCYWQFIAPCLSKTIWNNTDPHSAAYKEAVVFTGQVNGFYNIITFLSAFVLVAFMKKFKAKHVHTVCLIWAAISLMLIPQVVGIEAKWMVFPLIFGFGVAWASMMGVPYVIVSSDIPDSRRGVYMGIINMMIVVPMIIQTLSFGHVYKHFLGDTPTNAIMFAGALLLIAALLTQRIHEHRNVGESVAMQGGGH